MVKMMNLDLERFKDKVCFVSVVEGGTEYHQKGKITNIDDNFVYLETFSNFFAISLKDVVKIKTVLERGG